MAARSGDIGPIMTQIFLLGLQLGPKRPKLTQITKKMAPKGSPRYCMFMVSATVHNFGGFRPFWVRKRSEISPKMASIACYWSSKYIQFCPEWPQNDSQMTPTVLYSCGHYYCSLFGAIQVIFKFAFQGKFLPYDRIVTEIL